MRRVALVLLLCMGIAPVAALGAPRPAAVQQLEERVRSSLEQIAVPAIPVPAQQAPPPTFDGYVGLHVGSCNGAPKALVGGTMAPRLVNEAMVAWRRLDKLTGGHRVGLSVGLGREVLGLSDGRPVVDHWVDFHLNVGLFRRRTWEQCPPG